MWVVTCAPVPVTVNQCMPASKDKLVLVKHAPGKGRRQILLVLVLLLLTAFTNYYLGAFTSEKRYSQMLSKLTNLSIEHQSLQAEEKSLRQQVANLESSKAVDRHAKQEIQVTLNRLNAELSQLQKDITFYKNIMAPADNAKGLQLERIEISSLPGEQAYAYKIMLTQVSDHRAYVSGVLAVNLLGSRDGAQEVIALRDISEDLAELGVTFRFRYFQEFNGRLVLPEGFSPEQIQVVAQTRGKKASRIEQSIAWLALLTEPNR